MQGVRRKSILCAIMFIVLAGCSQTTAGPPLPNPITAAEIQKSLVGKTSVTTDRFSKTKPLSFLYLGSDFVVRYIVTVSVTGDEIMPFTGTWKMNPTGQICFDWPLESLPIQGCWYVYKDTTVNGRESLYAFQRSSTGTVGYAPLAILVHRLDQGDTTGTAKIWEP